MLSQLGRIMRQLRYKLGTQPRKPKNKCVMGAMDLLPFHVTEQLSVVGVYLVIEKIQLV